MKITRVLHVSINVEGRLGASSEFFARALQAAPTERPLIPGIDGAWFAVGDVQLHLVDAPSRGAGAVDPTGPHVCFGVEDLDGAVAELEARGVPYERANQGETVQIWFTDPSGFTIEIQQDVGALSG